MNDQNETSDKAQQRPGIQSVEIAATILKALVRGGGVLPLNRLAKLADLHPGKVHRYLISLTRSGLVIQDRDSGHYRIGPLSMTVGLAGLRITHPLRLAMEALPALRDKVGETVALAIWADVGATVIAIEESRHPVTMNVRVGSLLPLLSTAAGRTFAAFMPADMTADFLAKEWADSLAQEWAGDNPEDGAGIVPDRQELETILDDIREKGLAGIESRLLPGVNALAAPVFDYRGRLSSVIGIIGRREMVPSDLDGPIAQTLKETTDDLSRMLGHLNTDTA
ncbi:MAG: IclR family transcriptional regulator [Sphingomonadales bacterium]|nr:IclR family transcriptional regulator [Sphingomonadales bacterium]